MAGQRKSPDDETPLSAQQPGVGEAGAVFAAPIHDRWTIAKERLDEHQRMGAGTISVDEFIVELIEEIERRQASKA